MRLEILTTTQSLDNKVDSGEKVEDVLEENEETGSIRQDETNKENTKKENLAESVEERKDIEEDYDAKRKNIENNSYVEETEKRRGKQLLVSSLISFVILLLPPNYDRERFGQV